MRRPTNNRNRNKLWLLLAAGALLFALYGLGWLDGAIGTTSKLLSVPANAVRSASTGWLGSLRSSADDAALTRTATPEELEALQLELSRLRTAAEEARELREALDYRDGAAAELLAARVIYEHDDGFTRYLVIDRGSDHDLRNGQAVVTHDGILVGKIAAVRRATALVLPLTASQSRVAVAIQNTANTLGVLEGDRGLGLAINLIPDTEKVLPGDTIVTSGLESGIRRGLLVGTVERVSRNAQDPFQSAEIAPVRAALHPLIVQVELDAAE
ncbi:MAG: rod shape-determining protein MreC [Patescibacteria group bacterium]|jgi:rod shape-determining protein MreC